MKKQMVRIAAAFFLLVSASVVSNAQGVAIYGGLSTPNDEFNNVYNETSTLSSLRESTELGYHIGARVRVPLAASFMLSGGVSWNRFPQTKIYVINPQTKDTLGGLGTEQNIIPVALGLDYIIFNKGLGMFVGGELAYNYMTNSTTLLYKNKDAGGTEYEIPFDNDEVQNRVGGGVGIGVFFDAKVVTAIVDLKYNVVNLIGKEENENSKNYVTLSLGLQLGGM